MASLAKGLAVTDPSSGATQATDLASAGASIHNALLTGAAAAQLPLAIHLTVEGQYGEVGQLVPPSDASPSAGPTLLMKDEILCSEAWARFDPAEVERQGAGSYAVPFVRAWATGEATLCRYLPKGVVPADDAAPVRTDLPVLWLAGDADPQDPPSNLAGVPSQEPNSRIVVMPARGHVVGHLGCGPSVIAKVFDAGTATGLDTASWRTAHRPRRRSICPEAHPSRRSGSGDDGRPLPTDTPAAVPDPRSRVEIRQIRHRLNSKRGRRRGSRPPTAEAVRGPVRPRR